MRASILIAVVLPALALGQSSALPSGASSLPSCAFTCTQQIVSGSNNGGCSTITDINCICTSQQFQQSAYQCYVDNCTPEELQSAEQYGSRLCSSIGKPIDISATPSGITGLSSSDGASASSTASSSMSMSSGMSMSTSDSATAAASSTPASSDAVATSFNLAAIGAAMVGGLMAL